MPYLNNVVIMGNLTREPELREAGNTVVCNLSVAVNRKTKDREDVCFLEVVVFGKSAEYAAANFHKGGCVFVEGYLRQDTWEDRQSGTKREKIRVVANQITGVSGNASAAPTVQQEVQSRPEPRRSDPRPIIPPSPDEDMPF